MHGPSIVVIGTSAGGVGALQGIVRALPPDFPASVFVVMHLSPHVPTFLSEVLMTSGQLPATTVIHPLPFEPGHLYMPPADHHLIVERRVVLSNRGPRENWFRPSIDVLFRSAAAAHGPRVIGVVLTGFLDDGSAGLAAIQQKGGITMVQDPDDAFFPDMPRNALESVDVDHCLPLSEIPKMLNELVRQPPRARPRRKVAQEVAMETDIAKFETNGRAVLEELAEPSTFTCPECSGPLWELKDGKLIRFRCQVGHAYSAESMGNGQQEVVERSLWVAYGAIQSRIALWRRIADRMKTPHLQELAKFYKAKEREAIRDMEMLREILTRNGEAQRNARVRLEEFPRRAFAASGGSAARRPRARRTRRPGRSRRMSPRAE